VGKSLAPDVLHTPFNVTFFVASINIAKAEFEAIVHRKLD
jgi:hypothetical protein